MAVVSIKINGKDYQIACGDGEEDHLRSLADDIDDRVRSLVFRMKTNPGEGMALLLTGLTMADELSDNKKEIDKMASEIERLSTLLSEQDLALPDARIAEMENAMAMTIEEIAERIERISGKIEAE